MNYIKTFLIISLFFIFQGVQLKGETNHYSVITIENQSEYRVFYSYRWGGDGTQSWRNSIPPYSSYRHWWTSDYPNENWAPWFYIRMDGDPKWYQLSSFFSPNTSAPRGKFYRIIYDEHEGFIIEQKLYRH